MRAKVFGCQAAASAWGFTTAAMASCAACAGADATDCPVSGLPILEHVKGRATLTVRGKPAGVACPLGRHPDAAGVVRRWGVAHYGVPMLERLWLWTTAYQDADPREFIAALPGCGCIKALKDAWLGLRAFAARCVGDFAPASSPGGPGARA